MCWLIRPKPSSGAEYLRRGVFSTVYQAKGFICELGGPRILDGAVSFVTRTLAA
jgi:hypothetical protein